MKASAWLHSTRDDRLSPQAGAFLETNMDVKRKLILGLLGLAAMGHCATSKLWGRKGELWSPTSRLPDYSWAGYAAREIEIPDLPVVASIASSTAKPNDDIDDQDTTRSTSPGC